MKALVGAFNQEKALVGAFSVIVKTGCGTDGALHSTTFMEQISSSSKLFVQSGIFQPLRNFVVIEEGKQIKGLAIA